MSKGFGIAALVFAILAIPIPFGIVLTVIAVILAVVAALAGDKIFSVASSLIALVNTFVLSPSTWIMLSNSSPNESSALKVVLFVVCILPIGALVLRSMGMLAIRSS
jgi:hypothetical protein